MNRSVALIFDHPDAKPFAAHTIEILERFGVPHELVAPAALAACTSSVWIVYVVGKGSLATTISKMTDKPVLAVPLEGAGVSALEALQQATAPGEAPVGCLAIGKAGAINAALLAVAILASADAQLAQRLGDFRYQQTQSVLNDSLP